MEIKVNADNFQTADDGNTTHYGGTVLITCGDATETVQCHGTDRDSYNIFDEITDKLTDMLGIEVVEDEDGEDTGNFRDEVHKSVDCNMVFGVSLVDGEPKITWHAS